jgi:hypothetical protein
MRTAAAPSARTIALIYCGLALAALYPLLLVEIPPLVDYPNHLARFHVLARIGESAALQTFYEVRWGLVPNLALDAVAPALLQLLGPYEAGRVIVAVSLLLAVGGVASIQYAVFGRVGLWPTVSFFFVFNIVLAWGFLNCLITMALAFYAIAAWIGLRERSVWLRLPLFAAIAIVLFFGHLLACAAYGVFVAGYEAERAWRARGAFWRTLLREGAIAASQFAIPFVLWMLAPTGQGETQTTYGDWQDKVVALFSPVLFFDTWLERLTIVALGAALIRGLFRKYIVLAPGFAFPLVALAVAAVLMPSKLLNVAKFDLRLPLLILLLLVGVSRLRLPSPRLIAAAASVGLVLFAGRIVAISQSWQELDRQFAEFRAAALRIEPGARILPVQDRPDGKRVPREPFFWHLATLATVDRDAFSPTFFADPAKQPVRVRPEWTALHSPDVEPITVEQFADAVDPDVSARLAAMKFPYNYQAYWAYWPQRFDYVVLMHFGRPIANPAPRHLQRLVAGSYFDLYRVVR